MNEIRSTMAGTVWKVLVTTGQQVEAGEDVVILESMKMEIPITTEISGTVKSIEIAEGDFVNVDDLLIVLE